MAKIISSETKKFIFVSIIVGVGMAGDALIYCVLPVTPETFKITVFQIGILLSINRFVRLITNEISSFIVNRGDGSYKPLAFSVILSAFITLGYAFPFGFWWLLFLRILWGACFSLMRIEGYITALKYSTSGNISRIIAWFESIKSGLYGLLTISAGLLSDLISVRGTIIIFTLLTLCPLLFFINPTNLWSRANVPLNLIKKADIKKRGRGIKILLMIGFVSFVSVTVDSMLVTLRGRAIVDIIIPKSGLTTIGAATFSGLFYAMGQIVLFGGPLIGHFCDKIGRKKCLTAVLWTQTLLVAFLALFKLWHIVFAVFVIELIAGTSSQILRTAYAGEKASAEDQTVFMNRFNTFNDLGSSLGPFLGYALYAGTGSFAGLAVVIPLMLIAIVIFRKL